MITHSISAPTGCGITAFIGELIGKLERRPLLTVVVHPAMFDQWQAVLPDAVFMSPQRFLQEGDVSAELIIAGEVFPGTAAMIDQQLDTIETEVWVINRPLPPPEVRRHRFVATH